jgi:hypothetical protein
MMLPFNRSHVVKFVDSSATFRRFSVLPAEFILYRLFAPVYYLTLKHEVFRTAVRPANNQRLAKFVFPLSELYFVPPQLWTAGHLLYGSA